MRTYASRRSKKYSREHQGWSRITKLGQLKSGLKQEKINLTLFISCNNRLHTHRTVCNKMTDKESVPSEEARRCIGLKNLVLRTLKIHPPKISERTSKQRRAIHANL